VDRRLASVRCSAGNHCRLGAHRPLFGFSDTWQLVINTGTTVVTFLMVFLIQRSQNKDSQAIHLKLNELVAAVEGASNRLINVEDLTEEEVRTLHRHYARIEAVAGTNKT
jgi:low affinity Fe/Cu permease